MKTISFGLNEDKDLNLSQQSLDLSNIKGQYLGIISFDDVDYLITKVLESGQNLNNGQIDVREIARDYYMDGSVANYSNIEKSEMCHKLEQILNNDHALDMINRGVQIELVLLNMNVNYHYSGVNNLFINELGKEIDEICVTSVRRELFESLKAMKKSPMSTFAMFTRLNNLLQEREENQIQTTKTR